MKKIISAVVLTAVVVLTASCEIEPVIDLAIQNQKSIISCEIVDVEKVDSIPKINISSATFSDNPGDEVIIILPPKKTK